MLLVFLLYGIYVCIVSLKIFDNILLFTTIYLVIYFAIHLIVFIITGLKNNKLLEKFAEQLFQYKAPSKSNIISKGMYCGHMIQKKGGKLDFAAAILIESKLSLKELQTYYSHCVIKPIKKNKLNSLEIKVNVPNSLGIDYLIGEESIVLNLGNIKIENYYVVTIIDGDYRSAYDYRAYNYFIGGIVKKYKLF